jgi:hypothetical protein
VPYDIITRSLYEYTVYKDRHINQADSHGVKTQELKIWLIDVHIHIDLEEHAAL